MAGDFIPHSDGAFLEWAQTLLTHAATKTTAFNLPADALPPIQSQLTAYNTAFRTRTGEYGLAASRHDPYADPASVNDLANSAFDTKSPHIFAFGESERGRSLYICPRWENGKGEKGPWCEIVRAIVP